MQKQDNKNYSRWQKIAFYECSADGGMSPSYLLRHFQEMGNLHLGVVGLPYEKLYEQGKVFLLSKLALSIVRRPRSSEMVREMTWAKKPKGAKFFRQFQIESESGEVLAQMDTVWALIEPKTRKILKAEDFISTLIPDEEREISIGVKRIAKKEEGEKVGSHLVRYSELDENGHLNNAEYADIMVDFCPTLRQGKQIQRLDLNFLSEAKLDERINVFSISEKSKVYFTGKTGEKVCFEGSIEF